MVPRIGRRFARLVISLAILVISLPVIAFAAVPVVKVLSPVSQGIRTPLRIALDPAGNYYVADPGNGGVLKYNAVGKLVQVIKTAGAPQGVAVASNGNILVSQGNFVAELDSNGNEVRKLGSGVSQFSFANGIAVDSAGYIYVADSVANRVKVFNAGGTYVNEFGVGLLSMPTGIAYEKVSDQLAVVDTLNGRIQFFNSASGAYSFVKTIGTSIGAGPLLFTVPLGVAFEYSKDVIPVLARIYVVDAYQSSVQSINAAGNTFLRYIGDYGSANGQLVVPSDVAFDQATGRLIVVNGLGNLTVYGIDGGTGPGVINTTPLTLTIDSFPQNVSVSNITITGTCDAGATVAVRTDTAATAGVVSYTSGGTRWSSVISGLPLGLTNFTVEAKLPARNPAALTGSVVYTQPSAANFTVNSWPEITNTTPYTFTGTKDAAATLSVPGGTCTQTASWSCSVPLSEGLNNVTFNVAGATGAVIPIKLDTTAPTLQMSAIADQSSTSTQVQNVTGKVTDANLDKVTISLNGKPALALAVTNGVFSYPVTLDNSYNASIDNNVTVVATDKMGRTASATIIIKFDSNAPKITVSAPADGSITKLNSVSVSGSVDRTSTCTVAGVPAIPTGLNWTATVNLAAGLNTINITCTDQLNKVSNEKRTIFSDAVNPDVAVTTVPSRDFSTKQSSAVISGTVGIGVTALSSTVNGVTRSQPITGGTFSFNVDFTQEGPSAVLLSAVDNGGKTSTTTRTVIYDVTPPSLTVNPPALLPTTSLSGTVEAGASVVITDVNSQTVGTVTVTNKTWSADLGASYTSQGLFALRVTATDVAGNTVSKYGVAPDGDINGSGAVTGDDAAICLDIVTQKILPTNPSMPFYIAHGDIGPLLDGKPNPNGQIDLVDCVLILRKPISAPPVWW
ncbi:MAG: hypothetical protein FD174_3401 [Geobacteraceae bacterium]|nr:MAG: hypothetical protein FD174_3401 [Geobacteraceae bacterium]